MRGGVKVIFWDGERGLLLLDRVDEQIEWPAAPPYYQCPPYLRGPRPASALLAPYGPRWVEWFEEQAGRLTLENQTYWRQRQLLEREALLQFAGQAT